MGLVAYDSSDEDEDVQVDTPSVTQDTKNKTFSLPSQNDAESPNGQNETTLPLPSALQPQPPALSSELPQQQQPQPAPGPSLSPSEPLGPVLGPALGPSMPPPTTGLNTLPDPDSDADVDMSFLGDPSTTTTGLPSTSSSTQLEPPKSPYTTTRTLLRDLTLPAIPNMDIPPSPTLSPSDIDSVERLAALTNKFDKFLELKRTKGQHFNSRIAASAATRNPGLMDKLCRFVGVETEIWFDNDSSDSPSSAPTNSVKEGGGKGEVKPPPAGWEQYATTLSPQVWDPSSLPGWAYRENLRKTQERMQKENERKKGERVEFVSGGSTMTSRNGSATPLGSVAYPGGMSGGTGTGTRSGTGTPGAGAGAAAGAGAGGSTAGVKRKSRFDT
ncbi:hypothetical protein B0T20DRAFT_438606 [Sordaria brevicollis]|uniref:HCNGP-like protein n=1 Tax=Sordaria brevicollis TaxID=83679 RepID=A0AAE0PCZ8_SORBR|nr:hypothetical protein B0T20DRAFT_438606 [Sordaria brevicollis]